MEMTYEAVEAYYRETQKRLAGDRQRLIETPSHVRQVIQRHADGVDLVLTIERVLVTDEGTIVYVR